MQGHEIGFGEQLVEGVDEGRRARVGGMVDVGIVGQHAHLEAVRLARDARADAAEADDAERLAGHFEADELLLLVGSSAAQRGIGAAGVARQGEQQAERMLGHGVGVGPGGVDDRHPAPRRRRAVDVVEAGAVLGDQPEVRCRGELRAPHRKQPHHHGVDGGELGAQALRIGGAGRAVAPRDDAVAGAFQDAQAGAADRLGDQDGGTGVC